MTKNTIKKKNFETYDGSLYWLADSITAILAKNKLDNTSQKEQVEELILAEELFKEEILRYKYSTRVYERFIQKIREEDHNILFAKTYFRESSGVFSKKITPFLKTRDPVGLKQFKINFQFIKFIKQNWRGPLGKKAEKLYDRVYRAREVLMENNLPLVVNRAKIFYRSVPKSNLNLMDMISIASMGLANAVDKYTGDKQGKYSEVFRSVIIGRAVGVLIRSYTDRALHFFPSDRRIMYKANSIRGRQGITDITQLTAAVNASFLADAKEGMSIPRKNIQVHDLQGLMNASSIISVETTTNEDNFNAYDYTEDEKDNPEEKAIRFETSKDLSKFISELPLLLKKVLKLKGISF